MSNFAQTHPLLTQLNEFLRYAGAALLGAHKANNDAEKRALVDLARVLALAALESDGALITMPIRD